MAKTLPGVLRQKNRLAHQKSNGRKRRATVANHERSARIGLAALHQNKYASLQMPVVIIAGEKDQVVETNEQSARLHRDIAKSEFTSIPGQGHMIQQTATGALMDAIEKVEAASRPQINSELQAKAATISS